MQLLDAAHVAFGVVGDIAVQPGCAGLGGADAVEECGFRRGHLSVPISPQIAMDRARPEGGCIAPALGGGSGAIRG